VTALAALRAKFSTIALVWADGGYAGRLTSWAKTVLTFAVTIVKRTDDLAGFQVIPAPLGGRTHPRLNQQVPPLRPRLRNRSHISSDWPGIVSTGGHTARSAFRGSPGARR
jgi:hypothetical protein